MRDYKTAVGKKDNHGNSFPTEMARNLIVEKRAYFTGEKKKQNRKKQRVNRNNLTI